MSVLWSKSIGTSYYAFMTFCNCLLFFNLATNILSSQQLIETGIIFSSIIYASFYFISKVVALQTSQINSDNIFVQTWGHSYYGDFIILSIPLLISRLTPKNWRYLFPIIIFICLAVINTNSRSNGVALLIGILITPLNKIFKNLSKLLLLTLTFCLIIYSSYFTSRLKSSDGSRPDYWTVALKSIIQSPVLGNGPGTFGNSNRYYRNSIESNTNYAHNFILEFMSGNGLVFTSIFTYLIYLGLKHQYQNNYMFFVVGITSIVNSLLDPSWSSPGIFTITLVIIFWQLKTQKNNFLLFVLPTIVGLFFLSKTSSDISFFLKNYHLSLLLDPFNPNSLVSTLPNSTAQTLKLYKNDSTIYTKIIESTKLPDNLNLYQELFRLDPHGSTKQYLELLSYYNLFQDSSKIQEILNQINNNISINTTSDKEDLVIAKTSYYQGIKLWHQNQARDSLQMFYIATKFAPQWSHFTIEYANALGTIESYAVARQFLENSAQQNPIIRSHCQEQIQEYSSLFPTPGQLSKYIDELN